MGNVRAARQDPTVSWLHASGSRMFLLALGMSCLAWLFGGCAHRPDWSWQETPHQNPLFSPGAQFAALPPAVQNTVRAQTGAAEIENIEELTTAAGKVYFVSFVRKRILPPLYVAPDGSVMNPDLSVAVGAAEGPAGVSTGSVTNLRVTDLPARVLQTIQERSPGAEVDTINKEVWGERAIYIITFRNPDAHPKMYVLGDGTVLQQQSR